MRPLIGADRNAPKQTEDRARGLVQLRVFRPFDQNGSEHQAKEITLLQGEIKIGETDCAERIAPGRAHLHRCGEFSEPVRGDRCKKILLAGEMAMDGCRGDSNAARCLPQANAVWAGFIQDGPRRRAQGIWEIAMSITTSGRIHETSHIQTLGRPMDLEEQRFAQRGSLVPISLRINSIVLLRRAR